MALQITSEIVTGQTLADLVKKAGELNRELDEITVEYNGCGTHEVVIEYQKGD